MLVCLISNLEQFLFSFHEYLYALCLFFSLFCFLHPLHTYLASTSICTHNIHNIMELFSKSDENNLSTKRAEATV